MLNAVKFNAVKGVKWFAAVALTIAACGAAWAQSTISYGRITAVNRVTETSGGAQAAGAVVGGTLGLISGSGRSSSNRALRGIGGAVAGQQIGRVGSRSEAFEYTILIDGRTTITMVIDKGGLRVGDCVSVERGTFNNMRLVDDARCDRPRPAPAAASPKPAAASPAPAPEDVRVADACIAAKEQLLAADTDEAFDRAERRMRLLCGD